MKRENNESRHNTHSSHHNSHSNTHNSNPGSHLKGEAALKAGYDYMGTGMTLSELNDWLHDNNH